MGIGGGRLALCSPLPTSPPASGTGSTSASLMEVAPQPSGWWDASTKSALLGATGTPIAAWNSPGASLVDLSGNEQNSASLLRAAGVRVAAKRTASLRSVGRRGLSHRQHSFVAARA